MSGAQHKNLVPELMKLFSSSAQLSMKFHLLINAEIVKINGKFRFKTQKLVIYPVCTIVGILTFMSSLKNTWN